MKKRGWEANDLVKFKDDHFHEQTPLIIKYPHLIYTRDATLNSDIQTQVAIRLLQPATLFDSLSRPKY
jgi:hypothetical protein